MTASLDPHDPLTSLDPYLERIAHNLQRTHWQMVDVEDIWQEMRLYVLQQAALPSFSNRTAGHVARGAAWHARHVLRDTYTRWHNGARIACADPLPEYGSLPSVRPDDDALDARLTVEKLLGQVDDDIRMALRLSMDGYSWPEVADICGVTATTVYRWVHKAKAALDGLA